MAPPNAAFRLPIARRPYCRECGTSLGSAFKDGRENIDLTVASFDNPSRFVPMHHFGAESIHRAWLNTEGLPEHRTDQHQKFGDKWLAATGKMPDETAISNVRFRAIADIGISRMGTYARDISQGEVQMPEFRGIKITRAQESARHAYRRALEKAVRTASKGSGWRTIEGCLFREQAGWFVWVCPSVFIYEQSTKARVSAKPMSIDPIFWDIVGLPQNNDAPLSFRLNGAWTCRPPHFDDVSIEENEDVDVVAARFLETANDRLSMWSSVGQLRSSFNFVATVAQRKIATCFASLHRSLRWVANTKLWMLASLPKSEPKAAASSRQKALSPIWRRGGSRPHWRKRRGTDSVRFPPKADISDQASRLLPR